MSLDQMFFPYAQQRNCDIRNAGRRFVHYTNAEAAISIIRNREVWMRKSSVMNDFMEVEHGTKCFSHVLNGDSGVRFKIVVDKIFPNLSDELLYHFNKWLPHFRQESYLTSMSEHEDQEDELGRLSMWRAYGNTAGIALVLNPSVFLTPSDALKAYTSPVAYLTPEHFKIQFDHITDLIENSAKIVQQYGRQKTFEHLFEMFRFGLLCTKHPGFSEEREWRIIYTPRLQKSDRLTKDIVTIQGTPQAIYKIPLKDIPEENLNGASVPKLIDRVIIGPTRHPLEIRDVIVEALEEAGLKDAASKVCVSSIPLRSN